MEQADHTKGEGLQIEMIFHFISTGLCYSKKPNGFWKPVGLEMDEPWKPSRF
ncbi:hypothetical protein J2780_000416 [Chryseobacterium camelliae]|nr:hypothetical protein [Chryseobacterium camelliae]